MRQPIKGNTRRCQCVLRNDHVYVMEGKVRRLKIRAVMCHSEQIIATDKRGMQWLCLSCGNEWRTAFSVRIGGVCTALGWDGHMQELAAPIPLTLEGK